MYTSYNYNNILLAKFIINFIITYLEYLLEYLLYTYILIIYLV